MNTTAQTRGASPLLDRPLASEDRWSLRPATAGLVCAFLFLLLCGLPGLLSFFLIPIGMIGGAIFTVALLIVSIRRAFRQGFRRAISTGAMVLLPILLWGSIRWLSECAHLLLTTEIGIGQLGNVDPLRNDRFAVYDWSVGLAGGTNIFLIHDPSGEIALPLRQHKTPVVSEDGFGEECAGRVEHLLGHNYVCTI